MIKLKRFNVVTKDATLTEKRDIQFITVDSYVRKDQIMGILMHTNERIITDSWRETATLDYLKKEDIHLCTVMCKNIPNLTNTIVDEQILKLIDELV